MNKKLKIPHIINTFSSTLVLHHSNERKKWRKKKAESALMPVIYFRLLQQPF
jgi:hypothetical protein